MNRKFFILYEVEGYCGIQRAGPYASCLEAEHYYLDIVGFNRICNVQVREET